MNRRLFLSALAAAPIEPQVRRVYSFLWGNPLAVEPYSYSFEWVNYSPLVAYRPGVITGIDYTNPVQVSLVDMFLSEPDRWSLTPAR